MFYDNKPTMNPTEFLAEQVFQVISHYLQVSQI